VTGDNLGIAVNDDGSCDLEWRGELRRFRLKIGQLRELSETINRGRCAYGGQPVGPAAFKELLLKQNAWPHEVRDVIRLGLLGAGCSGGEVLGLMVHCEERAEPENSLTAFVIFSSAFNVPTGDPVGKKPAADGATSRSPGPPFTEPAVPSDSVRARSMT
jgi:hypothetical protein